MAMSKSYQVTLKKQLDTVSIRTNISYPLKSYLNIVRLILDSLGFRHQSFMKDNRRRKTPEFEFSSIFPTSYTRYRFFCFDYQTDRCYRKWCRKVSSCTEFTRIPLFQPELFIKRVKRVIISSEIKGAFSIMRLQRRPNYREKT